MGVLSAASYPIPAVVAFIAALGFFAFAAWSSTTGQITSPQKTSYGLKLTTLRRSEDPFGFSFLIMSLYAVGTVILFIAIGVCFLY